MLLNMDHAKMIEELKRYIKLIYSQSQNFESMIAVYVAMLHPSMLRPVAVADATLPVITGKMIKAGFVVIDFFFNFYF